MDVPQYLTVPPRKGEHWAAIALVDTTDIILMVDHLREFGTDPVLRHVRCRGSDKMIPHLVFFYEVFEGECTGNAELDELIDAINDSEWIGDCSIIHITAGSEIKGRTHPYGRLTVPPRPGEHWASVAWTRENDDAWLEARQQGFDAHSVMINGIVHIVFFYEVTDSASVDDPRLAQIAKLPGVNTASICHVFGGWVKGFDEELPSVKMPVPSIEQIQETLDETKRLQRSTAKRIAGENQYFSEWAAGYLERLAENNRRVEAMHQELIARLSMPEPSYPDQDALLSKMDALVEKIDLFLSERQEERNDG